jgi:hypothetical protein
MRIALDILKIILYSQDDATLLTVYQQSFLPMPYRRLPNTDSSRMKALRTALSKGKELPPFNLAFSQKTLQSLFSFLPSFEQAVSIQKQSLLNQAEKSIGYQQCIRKARLFISHFIQVMNMAIMRGELPANTRTYYVINEADKNLPPLLSEGDIIEWGKKMIDGETIRLRKGLTPITNPTIAVVKVRYEKFLEAHYAQKTVLLRTSQNQEKLTALRKQADNLIQVIWNEVEDHFRDLPDAMRREKTMDYGIAYVYRKNELKEPGIISLENSVLS